ncbi:hypothetical protein FOPG_19898 [Fusarium oxysporum f. sp. conglutinans race 2 54008]|uniref:Uncharacterized protein n=1 Tax=Fusarium oxysporum f. sp. conglutinans race 2 54008 TaxID=1089457 RepID=X0GVA6_FUSOX|nr:hypothetical protein FOPG_19898 [Fusarium oxysporum f. sp. conglutinans race 2 54008]
MYCTWLVNYNWERTVMSVIVQTAKMMNLVVKTATTIGKFLLILKIQISTKILTQA